MASYKILLVSETICDSVRQRKEYRSCMSPAPVFFVLRLTGTWELHLPRGKQVSCLKGLLRPEVAGQELALPAHVQIFWFPGMPSSGSLLNPPPHPPLCCTSPPVARLQSCPSVQPDSTYERMWAVTEQQNQNWQSHVAGHPVIFPVAWRTPLNCSIQSGHRVWYIWNLAMFQLEHQTEPRRDGSGSLGA